MSDFQENGRPIFDPYFYHCNIHSNITSHDIPVITAIAIISSDNYYTGLVNQLLNLSGQLLHFLSRQSNIEPNVIQSDIKS